MINSFTPKTSSPDSAATSVYLKSPRTPRFAEATAVVSPLDPIGPPQFSLSRPAVAVVSGPRTSSPVAFGLSIDKHQAEMASKAEAAVSSDNGPSQSGDHLRPITPPLKSALKTPGTAKTIFSPTFKEEQVLEKAEGHTDKEQVKDLKIKTRVRVAKFLLRGVSLSCSLIVLAMLSTILTILNTTRALPVRYVGNQKMQPWATNQQTWPQITVLSIAAVSLVISIMVFYQYGKGGHHRVQKAGIYYSAFALGTFFFSIIMWILGATVLQTSKSHGNSQDFWGWACAHNNREKVYSDKVNYALVCRLQNWSLICCIIEVIVDTITILVYGIVIYRLYTKKKLRRSMSNRDKARSDLYLAQLKSQSAPNTPGLWSNDDWKVGSGIVVTNTPLNTEEYYNTCPELERGLNHSDSKTQFATNQEKVTPFVLQPVPARVAQVQPRDQQQRQQHNRSSDGPEMDGSVSPVSPVGGTDTQGKVQHVPAAPGEVAYGNVPIPGAYT